MRLLVTGGGTGGHIFPGIAVVKSFQQVIKGAEIMFVSTARSMDQKIFSDLDLKTSVIDCSGLKGATISEKISSIAKQPGAIFQAYKILKKFKPDVVLGVGGYVTGPVIMASRMRGIPTCIHEQNTIPGLANKIAGKLVDKVFISIPGTSGFSAAKTVQTGNPVRQEILALRNRVRGTEPTTLVVLGGSQGAHRVNLLVIEAVKILKDQGITLKLIHQTGKQDYVMVSSEYNKIGVDASVEPFFKDMAAVYREADFAISRAGATTLAELSCVGIPAILIPFPYAADDHQYANGLYYSQNGGCQLFRENTLTGQKLAEAVCSYLSDPAILPAMGSKMVSLGAPDAAERIVDQCLKLIKK